MHLAVYVYDVHPAVSPPRPISLCRPGRTPSAQLTDDDAQVTCNECLGIMERLQLRDYGPTSPDTL